MFDALVFTHVKEGDLVLVDLQKNQILMVIESYDGEQRFTPAAQYLEYWAGTVDVLIAETSDNNILLRDKNLALYWFDA